MHAMTLYYFPLSTTSQKVQLCRHHKGISFDEKIIDLIKLEHLTPEYLAINPQGQVPTLVVDGQPLYESSIINEFLEELYPEKPLLPSDPIVRARIRAFTKYVDSGATVEIANPTYQAWVAPALAKEPQAPLLERVERAPQPGHRARWVRTVLHQFTESEIAGSYAVVEALLAKMERLLDPGPYLFGAAYSLADVEATPIVLRIVHLGRTDLIEKYPRVRDWFGRMQALPNFATTYAFLTQRG